METTNLIIEPLSNKHITQQYINWLNDFHLGVFMETRHVRHDLEKVREYICLEKKKGSIMFALIHKKNKEHIGNIKIGTVQKIHKSAEISYFIGNKDYWGQGLATEAVREVCAFAFNKLGLFHLSAGYYSNNLASERVLLKCGFKVCGIFHEKLITSSGLRENHIFCELLNSYFIKKEVYCEK